MQSDKEKSTKASSLNKLRLKRNNSDSSQSTLSSNLNRCLKKNDEKEESCSSNQSSRKENEPGTTNTEDSLADFKSPKEEITIKPLLSKFKVDPDKVKKNILKTKSKSSTKLRKSTSAIKQPSIESSFFKPQTNQNDIKESIPCPLCLRPFKDDASCTNHMKTCAAKNNVSIKQLLDAKRLQDRQAEERKAMGLLAAPVLPERKKPFRSKNFSTEDDPQLQLVLAMSESLYEAKQMEEFEQAALLAGIPSECIREMNDEERKTTLKNFGFTTNKPVSDVPVNRSKKRKLLGPTILQTRSKEDKDRVLTERIACILTGDDASTQVPRKTEIFVEEKTPTVLRSKILRDVEHSSNKLWDKSRLTKKHSDFYVEELKSHFIQSEDQQGIELHDSGLLSNQENDGEQEIILSNSSVLYEPIEVDIPINEDKEPKNLNLLSTNESGIMNFELDSMKNLISNWGATLNDSAASDVIILVKNGNHIYAHKLVFHVQCSNILLNLEPNSTESIPHIKDKICWMDKDQLSALAFLEFIYCGIINNYSHVFEEDDLISQVLNLARFYKVKDLFKYIRKKKKELALEFKGNKSVNTHVTIDKNDDNNSYKVQEIHTDNVLTKLNTDPLPVADNSISSKIFKSFSMENYSDRQITASPVLFESENEEDIYSHRTQEYNETGDENNTNLNMLIDLINDKTQDANICENKEVKNLERSHSQQTVVNLCGTSSPQSEKSLILSDEEDLHEAVTPKSKRSPELVQDVSPKELIFKKEIHEAVTPKSNRSPEPHQDVSSKELNFNDKKKVYINMEVDSPVPESAVENEEDSMYMAVTPPRPSTDNSIHTAITLPRQSIENKLLEVADQNLHNKLNKTDLNLFLDRIRKENAKGVFDTDSETETPDLPLKFKNPFLKRLRDDSYKYLQDEGQKKGGWRRVISMLEQDVLEGERQLESLQKTNLNSDNANNNALPKKNLSNETNKFSSINLSSNLHDENNDDSKVIKRSYTSSADTKSPFKKSSSNPKKSQTNNDSEKSMNLSVSDDEIKDITNDEAEMTRYSKYKKSNRHNNSIEKYRNKLKFASKKSPLKQTSGIKYNKKEDLIHSSTNVSKKLLLKNNKDEITKTVIEDITLVSDSDDEEQIKSKTILPKEDTSTHNNANSKTAKNGFDTEPKLQPEILLSEIESILYTNIEDDSTFPADLLPKVVNSTIVHEKSTNKVIDLSLDSDEESIHNESTFPFDLAYESDNSLKKKNSCTTESHSSSNKEKDFLELAEQKNNEVEVEISKILQLSLEINKKGNNLSQVSKRNEEQLDQNKNANTSNNKSEDNNNEVINLSPISIISSPEICESNKDKSRGSKESFNKTKKGEPKKIDGTRKKNVIEFDSIDPGCFDEIDFNDDWITKSPKENSVRSKSKSPNFGISNNSKRKLNLEDTYAKNSNLLKSSTLSSKPSTSRESYVPTFISSPILSKNKHPSQTPYMNIQKFSQSREKVRESLKQTAEKVRTLKTKSASATTFTENKKESIHEKNRFSKQYSKCAEDVTSPADYSILGTPELQKELKKFGLKPQKRENAKRLLRHIYNETRVAPQKRASSPSSASEDQEPPFKKQNVKQVHKNSASEGKSKPARSSKNCPMIAEEIDYDEPDAATDNPVSIKDACYRLIETNHELYTKVLMYEPLPLEPLYLMLKQEGTKCKINALMDFLDEQCITFQVQNDKGSRLKRRKN